MAQGGGGADSGLMVSVSGIRGRVGYALTPEVVARYAAAFGAPDAQEFYSFLRSLDVMRAAFEKDTTAVISTNSDLGRMLKSMAAAVAPANQQR